MQSTKSLPGLNLRDGAVLAGVELEVCHCNLSLSASDSLRNGGNAEEKNNMPTATRETASLPMFHLLFSYIEPTRQTHMQPLLDDAPESSSKLWGVSGLWRVQSVYSKLGNKHRHVRCALLHRFLVVAVGFGTYRLMQAQCRLILPSCDVYVSICGTRRNETLLSGTRCRFCVSRG